MLAHRFHPFHSSGDLDSGSQDRRSARQVVGRWIRAGRGKQEDLAQDDQEEQQRGQPQQRVIAAIEEEGKLRGEIRRILSDCRLRQRPWPETCISRENDCFEWLKDQKKKEAPPPPADLPPDSWG